MSAYPRRYSPPSYDQRPGRLSTSIVAPAGYYPPPTSYDDRRLRELASPRTSSDRVGKSTTTLMTEEKYDRHGRLVSKVAADGYQDPRRSTSSVSSEPQRRASLTGSTTQWGQDYNKPRPAVITQQRDLANISRPVDRYDSGGYYASPVSSPHPYRSHRQSATVADGGRSRENDYEYANDRRGSVDMYDYRDRAVPRDHARSSRDDAYYDSSSRRERRSSDLGSRERPREPTSEQYRSARGGGRDSGPPPATRALDKLSGASRSSSLRDAPSTSTASHYGSRAYDDDEYDGYPVRRRTRPRSGSIEDYSSSSHRHSLPVREEARRGERQVDPDLASRGFGLRLPSPPLSDPVPDRKMIMPAGTLPGHDRERSPDGPLRRKGDSFGGREIIAMPDFDPESSTLPMLDGPRPRRSDHDNDTTSTSSRKTTRRDIGDDAPRDPPRTLRKIRKEDDLGSAAAGVAAVGGAALLASGHARRHDSDDDDDDNRDDRVDRADGDDRHARRHTLDASAADSRRDDNGPLIREKYADPNDSRRPSPPRQDDDEDPAEGGADEDDDYMARLQKEMERARQGRGDPHPEIRSRGEDQTPRDVRASGAGHLRANGDVDAADERKTSDDVGHPDSETSSMAIARYKPVADEGASDVAASKSFDDERSSRVRIVEPHEEKEKPKGILKAPTVKFPDYSGEPRSAVAPHKTAPVAGAPADATYTRISRALVNPQTLEEAGERFEKDGDVVVVLRVVGKDQINKWIAKTQKIRDERDRRHKEGGHGDGKGGSDEDKSDRRSRRSGEPDGDKASQRSHRHRDDEDMEKDDHHSSGRKHKHHDRDDDRDDDDPYSSQDADGDKDRRRRHRRRRGDDDDDDDRDD